MVFLPIRTTKSNSIDNYKPNGTVFYTIYCVQIKSKLQNTTGLWYLLDHAAIDESAAFA